MSRNMPASPPSPTIAGDPWTAPKPTALPRCGSWPSRTASPGATTAGESSTSGPPATDTSGATTPTSTVSPTSTPSPPHAPSTRPAQELLLRDGRKPLGLRTWSNHPRTEERYRSIVTTENSDRYIDDFGGTSAATPIVSGVAALVREANPDLTWRDLKLILAETARKNDPTNPGWQDGARMYGLASDADRYHFNHEYGFGVVDAAAAVDLARSWTNLPPMQEATASSPPRSTGSSQTPTTPPASRP